MKMRTDVLWEPDKTDEHDRLLSRFEDDIIGLRARMNPDPNAYRPSSLDLEDAARMKSESELESTQAHTMRNNRDLEAVMAMACLVITLSMVESTPFLAIIPFATAIALLCAAGREQARAVKTMREYHETVSILENELDANDYQTIMGRPHPWKIL